MRQPPESLARFAPQIRSPLVGCRRGFLNLRFPLQLRRNAAFPQLCSRKPAARAICSANRPLAALTLPQAAPPAPLRRQAQRRGCRE